MWIAIIKKVNIGISKIVEKEKKEFLFKALEIAYSNPQVMNKLPDKFFADISISDLKNTGCKPFNVII